ncbi:MAG: copper resistance protein CopC [Dehalococcoidia bacterium]
MYTRVVSTARSRTGALVLGAVSALAIVSMVAAHAEPVAMSPASGATVTSLPAEVTMDASAAMAVTGSSLVVTNGSGAQVNVAASVVDPANHQRISVALPSDLPAGVYTVHWTAIAEEDGHESEGSWSFTYAPVQATATATAPAPTATPSATTTGSATPAATAAAAATATVTATAPTARPTGTAAPSTTVRPPSTGMSGDAAAQRSSTATVLLLLTVTAVLVAGTRVMAKGR